MKKLLAILFLLPAFALAQRPTTDFPPLKYDPSSGAFVPATTNGHTIGSGTGGVSATGTTPRAGKIAKFATDDTLEITTPADVSQLDNDQTFLSFFDKDRGLAGEWVRAFPGPALHYEATGSDYILSILGAEINWDSAEGTIPLAAVSGLETALQIPVGKSIYVDSVNGDDGTAVVYRQDKPFLTLTAAKTAAVSGDTIIVGPGSYSTTASLAKNGVNWHFRAGASVTNSSDASSVGIWDDGGTAMVFGVSGDGDFTRTSTSVNNTLVNITNASSIANIAGRDFVSTQSTGGALNTNTIFQSAGTLRLKCRKVTLSAGGDTSYAIWWDNGEGSIEAGTITAAYGALYSSVDATPTGDFHVRADKITSSYVAITLTGTDSAAAMWVRANIINGNTSAISVVGATANKLYVETEKIFGTVQNTASALIYITSQKLSSNAGNSALLSLAGGTSFITIAHYDAAEVAGYSAIQVSGGTANLFGGALSGIGTNTTDSAISVTGGTLNANGISADAILSTSANAIEVSGGTLNLRNSNIVCDSSHLDINRTAGTANVVNGRGTNADGTFKTSGTVNFVSTNVVKGSANSVTTTMLTDSSVTLAKMADITGPVILGRTTADATGAPKALTLGTGVLTAASNPPDATGGLLTYGIIGTSGSKVGLLNAAVTMTGTKTFDSSGVLDLSAASVTAGLKLPSSAGAAPTADSFLAFDTTNHWPVWGSNGSTRKAASQAGTETLTNKRLQARVTTITSNAAPTVNTDNADAVNITAQAATITSMTTNLSGTPNPFDMLIYRIKDDGTARGITWGASFASRGATLPTTTVISKVLYVLFIWNAGTSTWDCLSVANES